MHAERRAQAGEVMRPALAPPTRPRKGLRTTLIVIGLPGGMSAEQQQDELMSMFEEFGTIKECEVLRQHENQGGGSRGFAFVQLHSEDDARQAKSMLDNTMLPSAQDARQAIKVRWSLDTATLWVGDLGPSVTTETLREAFRQFGNVVECRIEYDPPELGGASKLFGFVEYSNRATASKVQELLSDNLFIISNSPRPVRVEFAVDAFADDDEGIHPGGNLIEPPPHFAQPGSLEFDFALKWREIGLAHAAEKARLAEVHRQEVRGAPPYPSYSRAHAQRALSTCPQREVLRAEQKLMYEQEVAKLRLLDQPELGTSGRIEFVEIGGPSDSSTSHRKRPHPISRER